jgi:hypothetical protein
MFISLAEGGDLRVIWTNVTGCLESRLMRGGKYLLEGYIGTPFISLGEVCLLIRSGKDGTIDILRPDGEDTSHTNTYLWLSGKPPHVARLPNGDEIVSYMYTHPHTGNRTMVIFRICCRDKTCVLISSINGVDNTISRYDNSLYAYLPSEGKIITEPIACIDFSGYSDLISTIAPRNIRLGNMTYHPRVEKIYDTFGDRMLILARVGCNNESYIVDYSFSTQAATVLDGCGPHVGERHNAGYAAENIVMIITLIKFRYVVRKIVNMTDQSEYILTDSV